MKPINDAPAIDLDEIIAAHEQIGYEKGYRDGYAEALDVTDMTDKSKYIKAEEAEKRIVALWRKEKGAYADVFNTAVDACQTIILDMYDNASQNVVSVVRCKDCKYASPNENGCTVYHFKRYETHNMSPDDFCSWGELRKDETN